MSGKDVYKEPFDEAENLVIYGSGKRGEKIYRILCNYGWSSKLRCFVETSEPRKERIGKAPIIRIDRAGINDADIIIISAAKGSNMEASMLQELKSRNHNRNVSSDDIIENYYMVC